MTSQFNKICSRYTEIGISHPEYSSSEIMSLIASEENMSLSEIMDYFNGEVGKTFDDMSRFFRGLAKLVDPRFLDLGEEARRKLYFYSKEFFEFKENISH